MKRIFSILLALTLMLALAVPAFAADPSGTWDGENWTPDGGNSRTVIANYDEASIPTPGKVYYVTVAWTQNKNNIKFTKGTKTYKWNGSSMYYEEDTPIADKWEGDAQYTVTVTNQSNDTVHAAASWQAASSITCTANIGSAVDVTTAAVKPDGSTLIDYDDTSTQGKAQTGTITVDIATPTAGSITADSKTVGTITVTVSQPTP